MKKIFGLLILFIVGCSNQVVFDLPQTSENFSQDIKYNKKVDFLFVIDNTSSMSVVQKYLADQIPVLTEALINLKMDYHIGVVTTTMNSHFPYSGKLFGEPKFIDSSSGNLNDLIKNKIIIGNNGATIEQGLDAMKSVLSTEYASGEGKGFIREDSFLNIIVLSNEDDQSKSPWTHYAELLDKLRPDYDDGTKSWALHFFGVISFEDPCPSDDWGIYKSPGFKFLELVKYSSGSSGSICSSDIHKSLTSIKARVVQVLTDYKLNVLPNLDSIKVYINNQLVPKEDINGWSYIAKGNLIRFNGASVPKSDDAIRVDFKPLEAQ